MCFGARVNHPKRDDAAQLCCVAVCVRKFKRLGRQEATFCPVRANRKDTECRWQKAYPGRMMSSFRTLERRSGGRLLAEWIRLRCSFLRAWAANIESKALAAYCSNIVRVRCILSRAESAINLSWLSNGASRETYTRSWLTNRERARKMAIIKTWEVSDGFSHLAASISWVQLWRTK